MNHYIPAVERDEHSPSPFCLCVPKLVIQVGDLTGKRAYYEHFVFDGDEAERQEYL